MKTVKIYIETSFIAPIEKDGKYAAILVFSGTNGDATRIVSGEESGTTFNRLTLIAAICAMERLNQPCHLIFYSENLYIKGMIEQGNPEKWRRAEWKKAAGTAVQNKELWELFLERAKGHKIEFRYSKYNDYKETLQAVMNGEEIGI